MKRNSGFTLVELAVALTLIGLLIGGALKSQELLENARVVETVAEARHIDAAMRQFRTIYAALPGDMKDAEYRIPGCNENCRPYISQFMVNGGRGGDGLIGDTALAYYKTYQTSLSHPPNHSNKEPLLFWLHLLKANLIGSISDKSLYEENVDPEWGVTHPVAKIGGGFIISSGTRHASGMVPGTDRMFPFELIISSQPGDIPGAANPTKGEQAMTAIRAMQIDSKIDDGNPAKGSVRGIGHKQTCFASAGTDLYRYDTTVASKDCSVVIQIQN